MVAVHDGIHPQPFRNVGRDVGPEAVTVVPGLAHRSVVLHIAQRNEVVDRLIAAGRLYVVFLNKGVAERGPEPVGIGVDSGVGSRIGRPLVDDLLPERSDVARIERGAVDGVHVDDIVVHHVDRDADALESGAAVVGDARTPLPALLGGDEDDAVGGARTVDGRRRGVLQDRHRGHVIRVDIVHAADDAVDHHQRRRVVERTHAADGHGGLVGAGLTRRLHGQQARRDALKSRRNVGEGAFLARLLEIDRGDGSRHVGFLLDAVGHDDDLFQSVLLLGEDDVDHRAVADPDTPGLVAEKREFQHVVRRLHDDRIAPVGAADSSVIGPDDQHRGPDHGHPRSVRNDAPHRRRRKFFLRRFRSQDDLFVLPDPIFDAQTRKDGFQHLRDGLVLQLDGHRALHVRERRAVKEIVAGLPLDHGDRVLQRYAFHTDRHRLAARRTGKGRQCQNDCQQVNNS